MPTRLLYILHSITPSKTKNEIDFSLGDIYTSSHHDNISVEMLSGFLLINRNSISLGRNTPISVFGGSLDAVADIVDKMKSNPDAFADASVADCGKAGRENGAMECSNIGSRKGTYDAVKLDKGEKSRDVRSYFDVTSE